MLDQTTRPVKVGDKIILEYDGVQRRIRIINKITPKGTIIVDGVKFDPEGREKTSNFCHFSLDYITPKDIEDAKKRTMIRKCQETKLEDLNLDQLDKIYKIMQEGV